jgi:tetratricopeptide (TPR) repeat protein
MNMGSACGDWGQHDAAEEHLQQALSIFQNRLGPAHTTTALCLNNLAVHHMRQGSPSHYFKAVQRLETCLSIQLKVFGEHHPDVVRSHHNLGSCWTHLDNTEKAEHHLREALDIGLVVHGEQHAAIGFIRSAFGALLMNLNRFEEALNEYNQSLAIRKARYPSNHPAVAIGLSKLGDAQLALARTEEARTSYRASHAIFQEKFGLDHANTRLISDKLSALS